MVSVIYKPNRVVENQRYFQADVHQPLWLRGSGIRKGFLYLHITFITVGFASAVYGISRMARGKKS
ncbi:15674_t:CDS:2 [Entrophospora sp. SA101]|nr:15674_t:CDS:2 [Entrophospora sp. SA101]